MCSGGLFCFCDLVRILYLGHLGLQCYIVAFFVIYHCEGDEGRGRHLGVVATMNDDIKQFQRQMYSVDGWTKVGFRRVGDCDCTCDHNARFFF